jgi:hypothetical protein
MGGEEQKPNTKGTNPMKRRYRILTGKATSKILAEQAAGTKAPRWQASALLWSEKKFRRVRVHRHLRALPEALQKETLKRKCKAS